MVLWHGWSRKEVCGTILWVGKQDDSTTLQSINSMPWRPSFQRRRNEICRRIVKSVLSNCSEMLTWHVLEDLIFHGQWINLHDRSQNGPMHVTIDWTDWYHTFITHVNTNSIAMWETLPNNAGWECFKTLTSQEILKIQHALLEERCAFLEVIRLFQQVWCARNKHQFSQFNRIRNHLFGHWTEIGRDSRSRFVGSDFCPWKHDSEPW